jgi:hypothetical protein
MTLSHLDEIEQPLMFTLDDMHMLLTKTLEVLATHKDPFASYIIKRYLSKDSPDWDAGDGKDDDPDDAGERWKRP